MSTNAETARFAEQLNAEAVALRDSTNMDDLAALLEVADRHGLILVSESEQCEIYERDGIRVNLWIDAPAPGIQDGGVGFDDQTEWDDRGDF